MKVIHISTHVCSTNTTARNDKENHKFDLATHPAAVWPPDVMAAFKAGKAGEGEPVPDVGTFEHPSNDKSSQNFAPASFAGTLPLSGRYVR